MLLLVSRLFINFVCPCFFWHEVSSTASNALQQNCLHIITLKWICIWHASWLHLGITSLSSLCLSFCRKCSDVLAGLSRWYTCSSVYRPPRQWCTLVCVLACFGTHNDEAVTLSIGFEETIFLSKFYRCNFLECRCTVEPLKVKCHLYLGGVHSFEKFPGITGNLWEVCGYYLDEESAVTTDVLRWYWYTQIGSFALPVQVHLIIIDVIDMYVHVVVMVSMEM